MGLLPQKSWKSIYAIQEIGRRPSFSGAAKPPRGSRKVQNSSLVDRCLITDGQTVHMVTDDPSVLEDVLKKGQLVFTVIAVGEIESKVTVAVKRYNARVATG